MTDIQMDKYNTVFRIDTGEHVTAVSETLCELNDKDQFVRLKRLFCRAQAEHFSTNSQS